MCERNVWAAIPKRMIYEESNIYALAVVSLFRIQKQTCCTLGEMFTSEQSCNVFPVMPYSGGMHSLSSFNLFATTLTVVQSVVLLLLSLALIANEQSYDVI